MAQTVDGEFAAMDGEPQSVVFRTKGMDGTDRFAVPTNAALQRSRKLLESGTVVDRGQRIAGAVQGFAGDFGATG